MKLTAKQAWLEIAHRFEKLHELNHRFCDTSSGLCNAIALANTEGKTCMEMNDQLRAYGNNTKTLCQFWFVCDREHAGIRALIAYFLAEMGEELFW